MSIKNGFHKKKTKGGMDRYGLAPEVGFRTGNSGVIPKRPTLVLIHGAGGSSHSFLPQIRGLDPFMNILALELPGHGNTPGPGRRSIASYTDWVHETLAGPFPEPFFLGGHSMGGAISLEMGLRFPNKIKGLILIATGAALGVSPKLLTGLQEQPHQTISKINEWSYAKGTEPQVIAQSIQLMEQTPVSVIQGDFQACNQFNRQDEVVGIKAPTLILVGDQDLMTPPGSSRFLQEKIPTSRLVVIPGSGHMIMLEKYKGINQAIREFISQKA
ncbi:MAG: alpha/beta hydrolase [Pseudomonadota bacterium]